MTPMLDPGAEYPGRTWPVVASPEVVGWSSAGLEAVRDEIERLGSTALVVVAGGQIVLASGDSSRPINVRSIRKSLLSALYGIHVAEGRIDLDWTLEQLGIDDHEPSLTQIEKQARISDLLKSRSGIYHRSNYQSPADAAALPPRGSHAPGTYWYYNNWDFNALGTVFERWTGRSVFADFAARIAEPLEMEDFSPEHTEYVHANHSAHPAYLFHLSARDLARFGLLYLRRGRWRDRQIVAPSWIAESSVPYSLTDDWTVENATGVG